MTPFQLSKSWQKLGQELCQSWGIDPNFVTKLSIDIEPNDFPKVTVTMLTDEYTAEIIKRYHLVSDED